MKRGRRILLILLACGVMALVADLVWPREREPEYKGRPLSRWISEYTVKEPDESSPEYRAAAEAVRETGTNAIPYFLKWLVHEDPAWRDKALGLAGGLIRPVSPDLSGKLASMTGAVPSRQACGAMFGFQVLGQEARSAVPDLTRLANSPPGQASVNAMVALSELGECGLPPLLALVTNTAAPCRITAVACVGQMGTNACPAVPVLMGCLRDKDPSVAVIAALALGRLRTAPDLVVPALAVSSQDSNLRFASVSALGEYGELARPAVPALVKALSDGDNFVRTVATNALRKIAPEVFEKGGHGGE